MIEWVLILTIWWSPDAGPTVTAVPGFRTSAECEQAGRVWTHAVDSNEGDRIHSPNRAVACVVRSGPPR